MVWHGWVWWVFHSALCSQSELGQSSFPVIHKVDKNANFVYYGKLECVHRTESVMFALQTQTERLAPTRPWRRLTENHESSVKAARPSGWTNSCRWLRRFWPRRRLRRSSTPTTRRHNQPNLEATTKQGRVPAILVPLSWIHPALRGRFWARELVVIEVSRKRRVTMESRPGDSGEAGRWWRTPEWRWRWWKTCGGMDGFTVPAALAAEDMQ